MHDGYYSQVLFANDFSKRPREPAVLQIATLIEVLLHLAAPKYDFMSMNDAVGATPILGLLVANTDAALQVARAPVRGASPADQGDTRRLHVGCMTVTYGYMTVTRWFS